MRNQPPSHTAGDKIPGIWMLKNTVDSAFDCIQEECAEAGTFGVVEMGGLVEFEICKGVKGHS